MSVPSNDEDFPLVKNLLNLPTYQRRLRHLQGIAVRNLQLPKNQTVDFSKLHVFFTLHKDGKEKALYTSEKITGSLNPTWQSFDLQKCDLDADLTTKYVVVRIWISHGEASKAKIEVNVHLSGLIFFADKLQVAGVKHQPNTLLFGMYGGYFIHFNAAVPNPQLAQWLPDTTVLRDKLPVAAILDQSTLRPSYNTNSLSRIHTVQRAIKQTQASVRRIHSQLEDKLLSSSENSEKLSEREVLLMKVRQLRHELLWQSQKKQSEQEALESFKAQQDAKLSDIKEKRERLQSLCKEMEENQSMHIQSKEMLVKENAQVLFRRKQIISEMVHLIYPITEDLKENFYICKVKLPNAENYQGQDETRLAVALGFTCHLVQMVSQFMDMPLRYPMVHRGSRSIIVDHIHSKLTEKDREFPLYGKGKEKFQYNYAVFLLNKNISQLRFYCGLGTNDLRQTLPNLKSLFVQRLGVRNNASQTDPQRRDEPGRGRGGAGGSEGWGPRSPTSAGPESRSSHRGSGPAAGAGTGPGYLDQGNRPGSWAASLSVSDLDQAGGTGHARSLSSLMSGSSGGQSSGGAAVVEGIDLTSLNGGGIMAPGSHDGNSSRVIVKPLLPDQLHTQESQHASKPLYQNGSFSLAQGTEARSTRFPDSSTQYDQDAIEEEEENEGDDLFKPVRDDTFFQVKRKQAFEDIHSVLNASENHETLPPSMREQVLGNGLMDDSGLPSINTSPGSESRTFKLVRSAAQAAAALLQSPGSSCDFSGDDKEEETAGSKSTSSSPKSHASTGLDNSGENDTTSSSDPALSPQRDVTSLSPSSLQGDKVASHGDVSSSPIVGDVAR